MRLGAFVFAVLIAIGFAALRADEDERRSPRRTHPLFLSGVRYGLDYEYSRIRDLRLAHRNVRHNGLGFRTPLSTSSTDNEDNFPWIQSRLRLLFEFPSWKSVDTLLWFGGQATQLRFTEKDDFFSGPNMGGGFQAEHRLAKKSPVWLRWMIGGEWGRFEGDDTEQLGVGTEEESDFEFVQLLGKLELEFRNRAKGNSDRALRPYVGVDIRHLEVDQTTVARTGINRTSVDFDYINPWEGATRLAAGIRWNTETQFLGIGKLEFEVGAAVGWQDADVYFTLLVQP